MSEQKFQVIINGQLAAGADLAQTKENIAKLFKTSPQAIEPMFAGKKLSVKKNLDQATAKKYQQAIIRAGLKAGVVPMAAAAKPATTARPTENSDTSAATIAAVGSIMDDRPQPPPANIDTSAYGMDEVGITLDSTPAADAPEIDISDYDMDEVGIIIDETPPPSPPEIDVSAITMKEAGEDLMEYDAIPEATFDLSEISMAEAGETLIEHAPIPPADIDTSNLDIVKPE